MHRIVMGCLVAVLAAGCSGAGDQAAAPVERVTVVETVPGPPVQPEASPAVAGPPSAEAAGLQLTAPQGFGYEELAPAAASRLQALAAAAGREITDFQVRGVRGPDGGQAAILLVTRYASAQVNSPEFSQQRRTQAAEQGLTLRDETLAGTPALVADGPRPFVSWTRGGDTLVVLNGPDPAVLRQIAETLIVANA